MDRLTPAHRSWNMSRIKGKNTVPELTVRAALRLLGYTYRLHRSDLPGRPDIVIPRLKIAIFVHGCFWHRHGGCKYAYQPKTRKTFWTKKFEDNKDRDRRQRRALLRIGWRVITVWECEAKSVEQLATQIRKTLISA